MVSIFSGEFWLLIQVPTGCNTYVHQVSILNTAPSLRHSNCTNFKGLPLISTKRLAPTSKAFSYLKTSYKIWLSNPLLTQDGISTGISLSHHRKLWYTVLLKYEKYIILVANHRLLATKTILICEAYIITMAYLNPSEVLSSFHILLILLLG